MISLLKASTVPEAKACSVIAKRRGGIYSPQPVPPARPVDHDRHRLTQGDRPPKTKHAFVEFFPPGGTSIETSLACRRSGGKCQVKRAKKFEPHRCELGVAHRVLDVLVPEIGLQGARVVSFGGEREPAGMPEHVGVGLEAELCLHTGTFDHAREASRGVG